MRLDSALAHRPAVAQAPLLRRLSDERLTEAVGAGSEAAFEVLFDRHQRSILTFCRKMLGSHADAEDAAQLTFLVAYRELLSGESARAPLRPWLYGIARHRCLTLLRARRERPVDDLPEPSTRHLIAEVTAREALRDVLADVAALPRDQRTALVLAELDDVGHVEIAEVLGCRRQRVKALVFQARSSLAAGRAARDIPCAVIRDQLGTLRGPALRRAALRRHLRDCAGCRAFAKQVRLERGRLRVLLPFLPTLGVKRAGLTALLGSGATGGVGGVGGLAATALVVVTIPAGGVAAVAAVRDGGAGTPPATARPFASLVLPSAGARPTGARAVQPVRPSTPPGPAPLPWHAAPAPVPATGTTDAVGAEPAGDLATTATPGDGQATSPPANAVDPVHDVPVDAGGSVGGGGPIEPGAGAPPGASKPGESKPAEAAVPPKPPKPATPAGRVHGLSAPGRGEDGAGMPNDPGRAPDHPGPPAAPAAPAPRGGDGGRAGPPDTRDADPPPEGGRPANVPARSVPSPDPGPASSGPSSSAHPSQPDGRGCRAHSREESCG